MRLLGSVQLDEPFYERLAISRHALGETVPGTLGIPADAKHCRRQNAGTTLFFLAAPKGKRDPRLRGGDEQKLRWLGSFRESAPYSGAFNPVQYAMNAITSADSSIALSVGLPEPCPARVSMRIR